MNTIRTGKIARLPESIRESLNRRLSSGESARSLLPWLNALPEVHAILAAQFHAKPILKQNLSRWRQGGYRAWQQKQDALGLYARLAREALTFDPTSNPHLTDTLALWLAAHYATAASQIPDYTTPTNWRRLRQLCRDITTLRRGDHAARRLALTPAFQAPSSSSCPHRRAVLRSRPFSQNDHQHHRPQQAR